MTFPIDLMMAFDVETKGTHDSRHALQPYRLRTGEAKLTSSAIAWVEDGKLRTSATQNPTRSYHEKMLRHAIDKGITLVGWNMAFDAAWLCAQGLTDLVIQAKWLDAMLLWQHLEREPEYFASKDKKRPWKLKEAVAQYWPQFARYGEDIDFQSEEPAVVNKRLNYNKMDVGFTLKLAQIFYNRLEEEGPYRLRNALIEADTIPLVADRTVQGLTVNVEAAHELDEVLVTRRKELLEELEKSGATQKILASPQQLAKLMYDDWDLPVLKKTPKGAPSTDKEAMYMLAANDDRAPMVQEFREAHLNRKKFVTNVLESVEYNGDGKTRPIMRVFGTYTGRAVFSSAQGRNKDKVQTGFALHQMKSAPEFRNLVEAPPGYVIVEWDAASQEYRWMGTESGDETMLDLCLPGEDPHAFMGSRISHQDYRWIQANKDTDTDAYKARKAGKVGNLSCCVADTEILTDNGAKAIQDVTTGDLVWDGHEFVPHDGVVYNGYKKVVTYYGLTATTDHLVMCKGEWAHFGRAAGHGLSIDEAGAQQRRKRSLAHYTSKGDVYDILNCGPRNQFGANGLIVHNCQYRIGYQTLRVRANVNHGMPIDNKEARVIHNTYHSTYKGVEQFWLRQIRKCRRLGYAETLAGRRVQLKGQWSHRQEGWKLESTAVNFPIQGVGADQKYLAMKLLKNVLPQIGGHFYFELHDGLYAILPEKTAMHDGIRVRNMLSNMPYKKAWGFEPPVPMPWDMKIGPTWGTLKEVQDV